MKRREKTRSIRDSMLKQIKWIPVTLSQEEENERIKEIARMLQRFMEENSTRRKPKNLFEENNFKKSIGL